MPDRVLEPRECAVVEEGGLQRGVPERRAAKLVAIRRIPRDLLQAEIFVLARPIEDHITLADAKGRGDLRNADHVHPEVAEHLVVLPGHSVTLHAIALAKEDQRAALLRFAQRCLLATRIAINRRIGEHEREFEIGDGATEQDKDDRRTGGYGRKQCAEFLSIGRRRIQALEHGLADGFVAKPAGIRRRDHRAKAIVELVELETDSPAGAGESGHFDQFSRRYVRLRDQQVGDEGIVWPEARGAFRLRKTEAGGIVERVPRKRGEPSIPHQVGIEGGVDRGRGPALVPRTVAMRPDQIVVLYSDRDGLAATEPRGGERATPRGFGEKAARKLCKPKTAGRDGGAPGGRGGPAVAAGSLP